MKDTTNPIQSTDTVNPANSDQFASILETALSYLKQENAREEIMRAYDFAVKAHTGQFRLSGEPYISHPIAVLGLLMEYKPDLTSIQATLLHDVPEDTDITVDEVKKEFGKDVVNIVGPMTKLGKIKYRGEQRMIENLRRMFMATANDVRIILIKLCDRLHNMQTLDFHPSLEKRQRISMETLNIYAPIAARLGMYKMREELQDLCFKHLYPEAYQNILKQLDKKSIERQRSINYARAELTNLLRENKIPGIVKGRVKSPYSIFLKMQQNQQESIDDLYDIFALRIVLKDIPTCYQTLGLIHQQYSPLSNRFKDYIGMPKPNGYQSIHTGVVGLGKGIRSLPTEIQIRTEEMDYLSEYGVAAHAMYHEHKTEKDKKKKLELPKKSDLALLQSLADLGRENISQEEFWSNLQRELFSEEIFVFTPKGDIKELAQGSTPLDFAYFVHTDIGHRCKSAKVNGSIVPLNYKLQSGDMVEIILQKEAHPTQYWLSIAKTNSARSKIKAWLNDQNRDQLVGIGRLVLNQQLLRIGESGLDPELSILRNYDDQVLDMEQRENVLSKIGNGSITATSVVRKIFPSLQHTPRVERGAPTEETEEARVLISGEKDLPYRLAACCVPKPKVKIIGFVTRGGGISVHANTCKTLGNLDTRRFISAKWSTETKTNQPHFRINVLIENQVGILREILGVFYGMQVNIINIQSKSYGTTIMNTIEADANVPDPLETLDQLITNLEVLDVVKKVEGKVVK